MEAGGSGNLRHGGASAAPDAPFTCGYLYGGNASASGPMSVHPCMRFINKSRLNPTSRLTRTKSAILFIRWMESLTRKLISYVKQVSWLTDLTSVLPLLACLLRVLQWDHEGRLSEYSDRIVQDSHLIPFSHIMRT